MSNVLKVELGVRSYQIEIGRDLLESLGQICRDCGLADRALLVSDTNVAPLYADVCADSLVAAGFELMRVVLPPGEATKCEECLFELYDAALDHGMGRNSFVVALGGGVVGDISGYMAASYLRGIPFVQVPTSLLAMVDSSVGGKTGINLPKGKNLVGAFHQPAAVLADVASLESLPVREWRAGLAEVVKYGVIFDGDFFEFLERNVERLVSRDVDVARAVVLRSCEIKAEVVHRDERENGLRAILNFGHTLGHAIENAAGYGEYLHGEAVAVGMVYAATLSNRQAGFDEADTVRLCSLLTALGLPVRAQGMDWLRLKDIMKRDKKAENGKPRFVLARRIGDAQPGYICDEPLCGEVWDDCGQ